MARLWTARPHRIALVVAALALLGGIVLLISPLDGVFVWIAWVLIVAALVGGGITLFFVRGPSS